jgi:cytidine deaminase
MTKKTIQFEYCEFEDFNELDTLTQQLINKSVGFLGNSYSPYSNFQVACSVLLDDGTIHVATNQENASYPVGSCAEQVVLKYVGANYPNQKMIAIAIAAKPTNTDSKGIAAPCGMCRQCILEYENKQNTPIKIYLVQPTTHQCIAIEKASYLLPIGFEASLLS